MARQSPAPSRQLHYNGDHMLIITVSREYSIIQIVYIQHTFALEAMMKLKRLGTDCTDDSSVPPVASASSLYTSKSSPVAYIQPPSTKTKCTCTPFPVAAESTWCLSMDVELGGVSVMSRMEECGTDSASTFWMATNLCSVHVSWAVAFAAAFKLLMSS